MTALNLAQASELLLNITHTTKHDHRESRTLVGCLKALARVKRRYSCRLTSLTRR